MQQQRQRPTAIFSVCAPSDIQGLERWEAHLHPLAQAGTVSIWSVLHLPPGTDREILLRSHLDQADLIILLLSADFFTDGECEALMVHALERYQQGTAQVIPLLMHPCAFRETELATFTPLPSDGRPIALWEKAEAGFDDCVRGLRSILGRPVTKPLTPRKKRASIEEQNRERMLLRLRRSYEELFTQSLQGVTQIELGLADKPDAVQNAATLLFRAGTRPEQLLPPGTSILDVYDEAAHELLILGKPGSGKSTLLVELARQLAGRAEADDTHPLPVILPLSSWATKCPPLEIWLVEQVAQIYHVPQNIAEHWIGEDQLLPLLDGLDEMEETARSACIAAINAYQHHHLRVPLVVCSRQAEYEEASRSQRLALQNAVVVQPLTHEHVQAYLKQAGKPLAALRRVLTMNSALAEIATTPLMVHVLSLTYQGISLRQLSTQDKPLRQQVWADYLTRIMERKRDTLHYPPHQTITWLSWLARQMRHHNQTIFYLEQLQPDWLPNRQRSFYQWSIGLFIGLMFGLFFGLLFGLGSGLFVGLLFGLGSGLFIRLFSRFSGKQLTERLTLSPHEGIQRSLENGIFAGLASALVIGLVFGVIFGLAGGVAGGLGGAVIIGQRENIEPTEMLTWSWRNVKSRSFVGLGFGLFVGLFVGFIDGLLGGLHFGMISTLSIGLFSGLSCILIFGLVSGFSGKQLTERLTLSLNEGIQRSLKNGLFIGLLVGLICTLTFGLFFRLFGMPISMSVNALIGGLVFGLFGGLGSSLFSGLGAAIQHYILRFWLWRTCLLPWKAQRLLDDAVTCILLRRVGGGYSFVHRLLLDYLADLPTLPASTSALYSPASRNSPPPNNPSG